jgi:hypothetical protein
MSAMSAPTPKSGSPIGPQSNIAQTSRRIKTD